MEFDLNIDEMHQIANTAAEPPSTLVRLPHLPWRSLGGYLNYEEWPERERFLELDQALTVLGAQQREERHWGHR
jgi:hypothetical protein